MNLIKLSCLVISIIVISACTPTAMIHSTKAHKNTVADGIVYSLPKQLVKVSYSRTPIDSAKAAANKIKIEKAIEGIKEKIKEKEASISEVEETIKNLDSTDPKKAEVEAKLNMDLTKLKAEKLTLTTALSNQLNELSIASTNYALSLQSDGAVSETLSITAQAAMPDINHTFYAHIDHDGRHSNSMNISVKNGMLDGAIGHSDDKTGDIFVSLVGSLSGIHSVPWKLNTYSLESNIKCEKDPVISISQIIDPDNKKDIAVLNRRLESACILIDVDKTNYGLANSSKIKTNSGDYPGLLYRQPGVYRFDVKEVGTEGDTIQTIPVVLAQGGKIGVVSIPKGSFTKNEFEIAFSNGALTKSNVTLPSYVLGAVTTLSNGIKQVFALPTELIQLKVNYNSSEKSLLELKKATLEQRIEIEKKQIELDEIVAKQQADE